jgi:hypothetical protein
VKAFGQKRLLLSIQLSINPDTIRHRKGEQRQITLSVSD